MDKEFETKEDMNIKENEEIINDKETTDESLDNTNETKKDYIKKKTHLQQTKMIMKMNMKKFVMSAEDLRAVQERWYQCRETYMYVQIVCREVLIQ